MTQAAQEAKAPAKKEETVVKLVKMSDGREVAFAGKRKMVKETIVDEKSAAVRFDFINGQTRTFKIPNSLVLRCAAHGASQKIGDEAAGTTDVEDIVVAIDDVIARLGKGEWGATRAAGDGFAGSSIVIRAIGEVTGKSAEEVKAFLQKKLDDAKAREEKLSRAELYASFRNPTSKTGKVIERMEKEKAAKEVKFNSDDLLKELK